MQVRQKKILRFSIKDNNDVVILLNDDIKINDMSLINKLLSPFTNNQNIGLVSGNVRPIPGNTFIEKAIESSFHAYDKVKYDLKGGNNEYTCDGKILALSKDFINTIEFTSDKRMGNVDAYLYFSCLKYKYMYKHIKDAVVYYKNPDSLRDYLKWFSRNNSNRFLLENEFGNLVDQEYKLPKILILYKIHQFLKNPLGSLFIVITGLYIRVLTKKSSENFDPLWESLNSTKYLK